MKKIYTYLSIGILFLASYVASAQVLISEDFEASATLPVNWETNLPGFNSSTTSPCSPGTRSVRALVNTNNQAPRLRSPFQVTTGDDIEISFDYKIINEVGGGATSGNFGSFDLQYSINNGASWTTYHTINDTNHTPSTSCVQQTNTIPGVPSGSDFAWRVLGDWNTGDYYFYVDNFLAVEQVDCIEPINITIENITFDSADVSWVNLNSSAPTGGYEIEVCPPGAPPGLGFCTLVTTNNLSETLINLSDGVEYWVFIRAICGTTPGDNDNSAWAGPAIFQTVAIGSDCDNPLNIASLPYTDTSDTAIYGNNYSGSPGINCGGVGNFLNGNDVVYHYTPTDDDILQIDLSDLSANSVGVFVYESCADIGVSCIAGSTTDTGDDHGIADLFVSAGQDYYIVVSSFPSGGVDNTDYTLSIEGFVCANFQAPDGPSAIDFVNGQFLFEFDQTGQGINTTITGAVLEWYSDAALTNPVDPSNILLDDGDEFYVIQILGTCESATLMVTFNEFDCLNELEILTTDEGAGVCDSGTITLEATANTSNIYWYDAATDGEVVGIGNTFTTPTINSTTSYWVSEVFFGEGLTTGQANPGPVTISTSTLNNYGLVFNLTNSITLVDLQVFITGGSGTMTIELRDIDNSNMPVASHTLGVPGGTTAMPTPVTIPLNFTIPPGNYRLLKTVGPSMLTTTAANSSFPYSIGNAGEVTSGSFATGTTTTYYYFYNWTIIENRPLCESARVEVEAVVYPIIPVSLQADDMVVCIGDSTNLTVSSTNSDYDFAWTWPGGNDTGATIQVSPTQPTTYTVTATDSVTGCQTTGEITLDVIGISEALTIAPDMPTACVGQVVELSAGAVYEGFDGATNNWTTTNSSSGASAAWSLVQSPHTIDGTVISSNDNSQFYLSDGRLTGTGSLLNTTLVSPSFNLVGVSTASLNFYHYYRNHPVTTAHIDVSIGGGTWTNIETINANEGEPNEFALKSISLNSYIDNDDVRVRFRYQGQWGWWWAIDNVTIKRNFSSGQVTWSPLTNLYTNQGATNPYTGNNVSTVYFYSDVADDYTYTATLNIASCGSNLQESVTVMVMETPMPIASQEQYFENEDTVSDLDVIGTDLIWYTEIEGQLVQISNNTELVHNTVYYVSQTLNFCESEPLEILAYFNCPVISDLDIVDVTGTTVTLSWTEPADISNIEHYDIRAYRVNDGEQVFGELMLFGWNTVTITGLQPETEYVFEIFTICNGVENVSSTTTLEIEFETGELSVHDINFQGFTFYPNPAVNFVNISNSLPIDRVEVYNILGQKLMEHGGNTTDVRMDFSNLASGAYIAKVTVGESERLVRIIKQ